MVENSRHATLGIISFGLALGITCAIFTFLLGISATLLGWGVSLAMVLSELFIGFGPTFVGSLAGVVWAFFDGFIAGVLLSSVYNALLLRRQSGLLAGYKARKATKSAAAKATKSAAAREH